MSDLVGNPEDRFSRVAAHIFLNLVLECTFHLYFVCQLDIRSTLLRLSNLLNRLGQMGIPLGTLQVNKQIVIRMIEKQSPWKVVWKCFRKQSPFDISKIVI